MSRTPELNNPGNYVSQVSELGTGIKNGVNTLAALAEIKARLLQELPGIKAFKETLDGDGGVIIDVTRQSSLIFSEKTRWINVGKMIEGRLIQNPDFLVMG